jgi:hypothetical protein
MIAFVPRFTITNRITAGLTAIERARGFLEAATLSDEWVRRMSQRALLVDAHATTHIEGAALTLAQAETVLVGGAVPEVREDDVREPLNYREAFNLVEYGGGGVAPNSRHDLRQTRARLGALKSHAQERGAGMTVDTVATRIAANSRHESRPQGNR